MKIIRKLQSFENYPKPVVLACGFFDGVHRGHCSILDYAVQAAREINGEAWVMTFEEHPLKILSPANAPLMITSTRHKLSLIKTRGVTGALLLPFSREFAAQSPAEFIAELFSGIPSLEEVVTGENWRFGAGGRGTPRQLRNLASSAGIKITALPPLLQNGEPISSTRIRIAIMRGELEQAAAMLGRHPGVLGTVVHGRAIGRKLGFPSANIDPHNEALPPLGVYAVRARVRNRLYDGVLNFGTRPTFTGKDGKRQAPVLELHLMDFNGSLYHEDIEASFIKHIRDEWYFSTVDELKARIAEDVRTARDILAKEPKND